MLYQDSQTNKVYFFKATKKELHKVFKRAFQNTRQTQYKLRINLKYKRYMDEGLYAYPKEKRNIYKIYS